MQNVAKREIPDWLELNQGEFKGRVKYLPERNHVTLPIEPETCAGQRNSMQRPWGVVSTFVLFGNKADNDPEKSCWIFLSDALDCCPPIYLEDIVKLS